MADMTGRFFWYELMTSDPKAAEAFYTTVVGWTAAPFDGGNAMPYTVISGSEGGMGGIMAIPPEAAANGLKPCWLGYIGAADVDADAAAAANAGGAIHNPPSDIPDVGRFAVMADPQGAVYNLLKGSSPQEMPSYSGGAMGHVSWNELHTTDWEGAFSYYSGLYGWTKEHAMDMGPMGTYQIWNRPDGVTAGGMMNDPNFPRPVWLFYFQVGNIDAAQARITDNGGSILFGPSEVPGGGWIINAMDPQGAMFALVGTRDS
ncbi:MAG: VOC family protein [Sphingobium phenoxybenzoativorans]